MIHELLHLSPAMRGSNQCPPKSQYQQIIKRHHHVKPSTPKTSLTTQARKHATNQAVRNVPRNLSSDTPTALFFGCRRGDEEPACGFSSGLPGRTPSTLLRHIILRRCMRVENSVRERCFISSSYDLSLRTELPFPS